VVFVTPNVFSEAIRDSAVAATKRSFDVAASFAIAIRAITNDPSGEAEQAV
jgi:hypothetical protein